MDLYPVDDQGLLFISPDVDDWKPLQDAGITAIIDLDGDLDVGVPTMPNHMLYVYFPFNDGDPPDCVKLHAVGQLGATLIQGGHRVLSHCGLGYNRSALVAGMVLMHLGMSGEQAVAQLRQKRPGALFNKQFASYLLACQPIEQLDVRSWLERVEQRHREFVEKRGYLPDSTPDITADRDRDV